MMLDSSLGKIFSTKPAEPPIPSDVDSNVATTAASANEGASIASADGDLEKQSSGSEAEVRLVVRFLVEEHIVFNGKVEQVKHLDKTELTRIVSRIAWDGAKTDDKPTLEHEDIVDNVKTTGWSEENSEPKNCCEPTIEISPPQSDPSSPNHNIIEMIKTIEDGPAVIEEQPSFLTTNDTSSSPDEVVPSNNEDGIALNREHISNNANGVIDSECDIKTTTSNVIEDTCDTTDQPTKSSYTIHAANSQHKSEKVEHTSTVFETKAQLPVEHQSELDFSIIEDQMIVATINDCVHNVELESRQREQLTGLLEIKSVKSEEIAENKLNPTKLDQQIETTGLNEPERAQHNPISEDTAAKAAVETDKRPLVEAINIPPNNESPQGKIPNNSDVNYLRDKGAQSNDAGMNDLNPKVVPSANKTTDNICSGRRKNTGDPGVASKRARRISSKDQQRVYRIGGKVADNIADKPEQVIQSEPVVESGYFARHSKILAKWSDNHFYPGTISKQKGDRKFEVIFYDGARKDVPETDLIPVCNILGKQVRITIAAGYCVNAVILDQLQNNGQPMFDVEYQQNGLVKKRVPLADIFLTAEQGIPLINQPIRPDKNPDESLFAGVDLDNIVHVKRSRRLQEMEDFEPAQESLINAPNAMNGTGGRRKRGQYNMRNITNRVRTGNCRAEGATSERVTKRSLSDANNQDTPASSCSPDTLKTNLDSSTSSSPAESSSSREANKF